jgi:tetratricopeptide (TPR) repeat protein
LTEHPTPAELQAFLQESLPSDRFGEIVEHLRQHCEDCRAVLFPIYLDMVELTSPEEPLANDKEYDAAIDRAFRVARVHERHLRLHNARARKRFAPVLAAEGVQELLKEVPLRGLGLFNALLEQSWAVRHEDPKAMVTLSRFAVDVAQNLEASVYGPEMLADFEAKAWGDLGNALRASDDLDEAERAFGMAFNLLPLGTGDPLLKARLYDLHASYLGTCRRFHLAFAALDIVHSIYLELNDGHLAGRALLIKAIYTHYSGRPEEAIRLNKQGLELIDSGRDPNLAFFAAHNHLLFLVACGQFAEAKRALVLHRPALRETAGKVNALKLRWLEGQIAAGLKEWESAERALNEVRTGFETAGMGFHAALSSLELALVWMHQGEYLETAEMVFHTVEVFVALRIRREALGAMMVLRDAFEGGTATIGLLEGAVDYLRRLQIDPDAHFDPSGE